MRLYIIRHAEKDDGHNTITRDGQLEAISLADRLAAQGLDILYSAQEECAIQTAQYTAKKLKMAYTIEEWTNGVQGLICTNTPWGDVNPWDIPGEAIRGEKTIPGQKTWHMHPYLCQKVFKEKFDELVIDSDDFFYRHGYERKDGRYRCLEPNQNRIAFFCGSGFGLAWLAHILEMPLPLMWTGFWLPSGSITTVLFEERSREWAVPRCISLGDVSHLHKAGLPVKSNGIKANIF